MALGSTASPKARAFELNACYGVNASLVWPASFELAIFHGDPTAAGTELTSAGGYIRTAIPTRDATVWPEANLASGWKKKNGVPISMAPSTGAWSATGTYWAFIDADDNLLDSGLIVDPADGVTPLVITVSAAGVVVRWDVGEFVIGVS